MESMGCKVNTEGAKSSKDPGSRVSRQRPEEARPDEIC